MCAFEVAAAHPFIAWCYGRTRLLATFIEGRTKSLFLVLRIDVAYSVHPRCNSSHRLEESRSQFSSCGSCLGACTPYFVQRTIRVYEGGAQSCHVLSLPPSHRADGATETSSNQTSARECLSQRLIYSPPVAVMVMRMTERR